MVDIGREREGSDMRGNEGRKWEKFERELGRKGGIDRLING